MKSSRALRAEREKFTREMESAREERRLEVAFHNAQPQHTPEMGKMLAEQFVAAILAITEKMVVDYKGERSLTPIPDHAPYWEIKGYLTEEQKTMLAAARARVDQLELEQKAKDYDALVATLERCGLNTDTLIGGAGEGDEDIITVENLRTAREWCETASANAFEDGEE
jgi:hypothetical protein